jgi:hypothetical protein
VTVSQVAQLPDLVWIRRAPPAWTGAPGPAVARTAMLVVAAVAASVLLIGLIVGARAGPAAGRRLRPP